MGKVSCTEPHVAVLDNIPPFPPGYHRPVSNWKEIVQRNKLVRQKNCVECSEFHHCNIFNCKKEGQG